MHDHNDNNLNSVAQRNGLLLPLVSNILLLIVVVGVVWWGISIFQSQIRVGTLSESRFVTMEWNLLQQLKAQTDGQLIEKDREIAALRQRYADLLERGGTPADRERLEAEIQGAEEERRSIVQRRMDVAAVPGLTPGGPDASREEDSAGATGTAPLTDSGSVLTRLLREQNQTLMTQLQELEDKITHSQEVAESVRRSVAQLPFSAEQGGQSPPSVVQQQPGDQQQSTTELLRTRTLLRAVVTKPEIRAEHPELLRELERYLQTLESRASIDGQGSAYRNASAALDTLATELGISMNPTAAGSTLDGYLERLKTVVMDVVDLAVPEA